MEQTIPPCIVLPHSKAAIHFTSGYSKEKLTEFTRRLIDDEKLAAQMRCNPTEMLAELGIIVTDEDRKRIKDEDILAAMGHRAFPGGDPPVIAALPLVIVLVVVGVVNFPEPAY